MKYKINKIKIGLLVVLAMAGMPGMATAQVGVNTTTPDASSILDLDATSKGLLIPRIPKASRPATPAEGLLIYQTDETPGFYFYRNSAWKRMAISGELAAPVPEPNVPAIIPFSSGIPATLSTVLGGILNTSSIVGSGTNASGITVTGNIINLTGGAGVLLNQAFSMPRKGIITSVSAYFSTTTALTLVGSTLTLTAQVYKATAQSNNFEAVPGALVTMAPPLTGVLGLGSISNGITTGLYIQVNAGDRLMLVFTPTVTAGLDISTVITGYASGGLVIDRFTDIP